MRHLAHVLALAALVSLALISAPGGATAQSDILLQLRSGAPAGDRVRVDSAGGFVAMGQLGVGIIPASGCGYRMMWHPFKGAFRAGTTDDGGACDAWNDSNIGFYSWAGGNLSRATAFATFAFGDQVTVTGVDGAGFGANTLVSGTAGFATGAASRCTGFACVAMGFTNTASGQGSVAIGYRSTANADYSVAIGQRASTAGRMGAMVFSDASTTDSIRATANNEFAVRAAGGFRFRSNATLTNGCNIAAGGASITCASSKTLKENFSEVDGEDVLARMRRVPVNTWNYTDEGRHSRHLGPFAEDFWREFQLGDEPLAIGHLDIDGVNFAGVKALDQRTAELQSENQALRTEVEQLKAKQAEMERRLERLEAAQAPRP